MLTLDIIQKKMAELQNWALEGDSIVKDVMLPDFSAALDFVNKVGEIAEARQHHPMIIIEGNHVRLSLTTHEESGLSEKDLDMAKEIDKI